MCVRLRVPSVDDVFPSAFRADIISATLPHETSASCSVFVTEAPTKQSALYRGTFQCISQDNTLMNFSFATYYLSLKPQLFGFNFSDLGALDGNLL